MKIKLPEITVNLSVRDSLGLRTQSKKKKNISFHLTGHSGIRFYAGTCRWTCLHTTQSSEKLQSGCCLNRCLVCPEQHTAVCFYWPTESTESPLHWSLLPPPSQSKVEGAGKGTDAGSKQAASRSRRPRTGWYKQDCVATRDWYVARVEMSSPGWVNLRRSTGVERHCTIPNSFQTIQNRPVNPSLMVTKCQLKDECLSTDIIS